MQPSLYRTLVVMLIAVLLIGTAAYLLTRDTTPAPTTPGPTPTSTDNGTQAPTSTNNSVSSSSTNWLVLRNTQKGFEVRYPPPVDMMDLGGGEFHLFEGGHDIWLTVRILPDSYRWSGTSASTCPDLLTADGQRLEAQPITVSGTRFCLSKTAEGAAGSTYEDYHYVASSTSGFVDIQFIARHATDVSVYEQCDTPSERETEECQLLQWNELRDTALFNQILVTYRPIPVGS